MAQRYEAVVIGTGFGGSITGCRLAKRWDSGRILILERGKRYPMGSFSRSPRDFAHSFWALASERTRRPAHVTRRLARGGENSHGLFDVRNYEHMDVLVGAGLGGGSLIYANVFMIPPDEVFDDRWPSACKRAKLGPYYKVVKEVLGSRPIPSSSSPLKKPDSGSRL